MSYDIWQNNYAGDPSVVGSTFWINTKPVTITGIAPKGFYGDRLSSAPPDFYLPIESMPVLTNRYFRARARHALALHHRPRKTRRSHGSAPGQNHRVGPAILRSHDRPSQANKGSAHWPKPT